MHVLLEAVRETIRDPGPITTTGQPWYYGKMWPGITWLLVVYLPAGLYLLWACITLLWTLLL